MLERGGEGGRRSGGPVASRGDSLEWARSGNRTRLVKLLNLVRTEMLFDIDSSDGPWLNRNRVSRADATPSPKRAV
ncbi:hypothetical protein GBA63_01715 [Rubrobacter tropicus]|uniref:Uncharacterized protein n=1 Tax=Rubrobacter tropicus TaxID=2653851 RepID=A0A6G8Q4R0_9ACTN|nr:hypothetical protein [Rubrobacter tropicus]QIN81484.1 hypothetical protein GBA63_01715 [Rubrobacter tropicus]